jgi:hypothetical protein
VIVGTLQVLSALSLVMSYDTLILLPSVLFCSIANPVSSPVIFFA